MKIWYSTKLILLLFFLIIPNLFYGQSLCPITSSDIRVCPNTNAQLNASGVDYYTWTPSLGLSDTTIANPIVNVPKTTTYYVTGYTESKINLITNGDFESGNKNFITAYNYSTDLVPEGNYYVGANPKTYHPSFSPCVDHTSGTGNMLIVNGNPVANSIVWQQSITIQPNKDYAFYAYVTPVSPLNPAILQFSINGKVLGTPYNTPLGTCNWNKFYAIWNSGSTTSAVISIVNQNIIKNGNDFALDDIKYVELCRATNKVTVTVGPLTSITNISKCNSELPYIWNTQSYNTSGTYSSTHLISSDGCDSTAILNLTVNPTPTVTNTSLTQTICSGTSTTLVPLTSNVALTTFEWTASTGGITGFTTSGTNTIPVQTLTNPSNLAAGTVTYVITPKANGCTGTAVNYVVTVTPKPITSDIYHP